MDLHLSTAPIAKAEMLIHRPAAEVYEAFVDPAITTKFWFTKSSGRLEVGKELRWVWEMYGVSTPVRVKALDPGRRILIEWGDENPTTVEWTFSPHGDRATFVSIRNTGFKGDGEAVVQQAMDSATGFTLVLAGLKAYLEHGIELHLNSDRFPEQTVDRPKSTS